MSIPPPPKQLLLSLFVDKLHLKVPQWALVVAVLLPSGVWYALGDSRGTPLGAPVPMPVPQVPLQASAFAVFPPSVATLGALPDGVEMQRKPPCDPDAEEAIGGWCWIPLNVAKCPVEKGKAFEHEKKCYLRSFRAARAPTTGEPRPLGVADP